MFQTQFKKQTNSRLFFAICALAIGTSFASCSDEEVPKDQPRESEKVEFFIAATQGEASYLLAVPDVTKGTTTIKGKGLEADAYTAWVFPTPKVAIGLKYQKGDPGIGIGVALGPDGKIVKSGSEFQIKSRFTTYGPFQDKVLSIVGGVKVADDSKNIYSTFNFIDPANGNAVTTITKNTTNLTGNGEYATLSGVVPFGPKEFLTALVPSVINSNTGGGGASTGQSNYPDSVWIASYDKDLNIKHIYGDDRIGYASGRFRSQYYSSIAQDGKNNVYVFSPANDSRSTKPAGVIRINAGSKTFDKSYYWNLESAVTAAGSADPKIKFQRVYHIDGDYFALTYVRPGTTTQKGPAQPNDIAILNAVTKTFQWVKGLPDFNANPTFGLAIAEDGKLYIPVTETGKNPAIYIIDAASGTASKGLEVEASEITAIGKLSK